MAHRIMYNASGEFLTNSLSQDIKGDNSISMLLPEALGEERTNRYLLVYQTSSPSYYVIPSGSAHNI